MQPSIKLEDRGDSWVHWVNQVAQGEQAALGSLYDATSGLVYGLTLRILGDTSAAEEVTLDVYLQVWRQAGRFDSTRGRVSTWLMTIARSRAIDRLRSRQKLPQTDSLEAVAEPHSEASGPEELAMAAQRQIQVRQGLATISVEQRLVIELAFFGGLSQSEIALKLNKPLGTIKTRIRSGMIVLRRVV